MKIVRNHKLFEDFFDDVKSEDVVDNEVEETPEYKGNLRFAFNFEFNKNRTHRENIDKIPFASIVKRFISVANAVSFIDNYSAKVTVFSREVMMKALKSGMDVDAGYEELTDKKMYDNNAIGEVLYGFFDSYMSDETMTNPMNIMFMISFYINPVAVPFIKFVNDFKKFLHIVQSFGTMGFLLSDATKLPSIVYTVNDVPEDRPADERQWTFAHMDSKFMSLKTIWDLGSLIFGTDNKWWNEEARQKAFSVDDVNTYNMPYVDNVPVFLKKMNKYFSRHQEDYICKLAGYSEDENTTVVYLDSKNYNSLTVKDITEYFRKMFNSFSVPEILSVKKSEESIKLYVVCYELPEKRPGKKAEKLKYLITSKYPFGVYLWVVDDSEYKRNFIDTGHTNADTDAYSIQSKQVDAAIENFNKKLKDEINKKQ